MLESLKKNESFSYIKLSPEEMAARGILGRLVGPCADFTAPTRNGRRYEEELWDKVFNDEIVNEKIANKCLFGELGHPLDREEVDPEKIAIALNERPKKNQDGQLIACFDILNTPSGKILKTLCDYGTTIGISSRGSGDIVSNMQGEDVVDPDTYCFECFDAVILPAVKQARLAYMTESVDNNNNLKMKKALTEAYNKATDEEKKVMKETLDDLDIQLDTEEEVPSDTDAVILASGERISGDIPIATENENEVAEVLTEAEEETEVEETEEESSEEQNEDESYSEASTVSDLIGELQDYDEDLELEFQPIEIDGKEITIEGIEFDSSEEGKLKLSIGYSQEIGDNIEDAEEATEEVSNETEEETEEAEDNGDAEVLESCKEIIRQKDLLEQELKNLKEEKTVRDAEVNELKESLKNYKEAFNRTSEIAATAKELNAKVNQLTEQLTKQTKEIDTLKQAQSTKLAESASKTAAKINALTEELKANKVEMQTKETEFNAQLDTYKKQITESTKAINTYKTRCNEAVSKYISYRASMLGVKPAEIVDKLDKNYTMSDIDNVCDSILTEGLNISRLPFGINSKSRVKIESKQSNVTSNNNGYDIDDSLLELAGLK